MPTMLTLKEASETTGYSVKTLRNRIKAQELRAVQRDTKYGPTYFIPETEVVRMMASEAGRPDSTLSTTPSNPVPTPAPAGEPVAQEEQGGNAMADLLMRLTSRIEEQAHELGTMKALTERAQTLEVHEQAARSERDRLMRELAETRAELNVLRERMAEQAKPSSRRWFSRRDKGGQTFSTPAGQGSVTA